MSRLHATSVPWALGRLALGRRAIGLEPGLRFARVLGSGRGGGFGLAPGLDCQGVFATFDTVEQAEAFAEDSFTARAYRARALEHFHIILRATSVRGSWGGEAMSVATPAVAEGPVAALTRASIRPGRALAFWRHSPPAEADLAQAAGCLLAVGLGEAPVLRQATFSLWRDAAAMDAYARQGAHQRAIEASWSGAFFSEWMFVRFMPVSMRGRWRGQALG